jgi:hypothetical protein
MSSRSCRPAASTGSRVVRRIHGIGPARRVEIALGGDSADKLIEVDALRSQQLRVGQLVGLRPEQYRLFPAG